jgi:hypothetical protein
LRPLHERSSTKGLWLFCLSVCLVSASTRVLANPRCRQLILDGLVCSTALCAFALRLVERVHALFSFQRTEAPARPAYSLYRIPRDLRFRFGRARQGNLSMLPRSCLPVNPFRSSGLVNRGELRGLPGWAAMPLTEGIASTRLVILRVRPVPVNLFDCTFALREAHWSRPHTLYFSEEPK